MLTSTKAEEYATDWANERHHNSRGKLDELDLSQGWLAGYYAARHRASEEQLHLAEQQLEVARKALKAIADDNSSLLAVVETHGTHKGMWTLAVKTAKTAIQDMRNLKRK